MIVVQGTIPVKPELRNDALQAAQEMMEASQAEPGCITYEFFVGLANPNTLMLFQEWDSVDALQDHYKSSHTEVFLRKLVDFLDGEIATRRYAVVEDDDEDEDIEAGAHDGSDATQRDWDEDDRGIGDPGEDSPRRARMKRTAETV